MTSQRMADLAREFKELKERKEGLEDALKNTNKSLKLLRETTIPEYMDDNDIQKVTVDGVGTVYTQTKVYASVLAADREALYEALRESGDEALIKDWVFPATLTAFCKEAMENGQEVPSMVKTALIETAMLRKI